MQRPKPSKPCDIWEHGVDGRGVAVHRVRTDGKLRTVNAVRIFWELTHTACLLPSTVLVMTCGNRRCIEPSHAHVMTRQQAARRPRRSRHDMAQQRCPCKASYSATPTGPSSSS